VAVSLLEISELSQRCKAETRLYYQGTNYDTQYCFELFRRCFTTRDAQVWQQVYELYESQIASWVRTNSAYSESGEEVQYFVNRAIEKIWASISPEKFAKFPNLPSLMRYLKMCVASVIIDHYRSRERLASEDLDSLTNANSLQHHSSVEEHVFDQAHAQQLWQLCSHIIEDEREYDVLYKSFVLDMKPREILQHFPGIYADIKEIYRVKENVLQRLRRSEELSKFFVDIGGETE